MFRTGGQGGVGSGGTVTAAQLLAPDGSATAPSHSFTNAPNMGMYNGGGNNLGLAAGGGVAASFNNQNSVTFSQWGSTSTYQMSLASGLAGNADRAGINFLIGSGQGTGLGAIGYIAFQQTPPALATGSAVNAYVTTKVVHNVKSITNNTGTAMVNFTLASNTVVAGTAKYAVEVFNGTDLQIEEGYISFQCINKAGVFSGNTVVKFGNQQATTAASTLTVTWTITGANPSVLTLNANSSLTPSTGYPRITYSIENLTQQAIALQ